MQCSRRALQRKMEANDDEQHWYYQAATTCERLELGLDHHLASGNDKIA